MSDPKNFASNGGNARNVTSRQKYDGEDIIGNFRETEKTKAAWAFVALRRVASGGVRMHSSSVVGVLA
jgi:hypothetical protein